METPEQCEKSGQNLTIKTPERLHNGRHNGRRSSVFMLRRRSGVLIVKS